MQVKALIDRIYEKMEIHVCNHEMNQEVEKVVKDISDMFNAKITGTDRKGDRCILALHNIVSFFASGQKVMARDELGNEFSILSKLYELEEKLKDDGFVRISKSEIVNMKKIKRLDMTLTGTIKVIMSDKSETYTSRRNVSKLKEAMGIGGKK